MTDRKFVDYFRRAVLILVFCLILCIISRIVFACTIASENKAKEENSAELSSESSSSREESSQNESITNDPTDESDSDTETEPLTENDIILKPTSDAGADYIKDIVFLGDSTTYGLSYFGVINENQVWTGAGDNGGTIGTLSLYTNIDKVQIYYPDEDRALTIGEAAALKKPKYLVITLGLNGGVGDYFEEREFKASYRKLLNSVSSSSPDTVIIIQNIFPVASNIDNSTYKKLTNANIQTANGWLKDLAIEYGLKYLDSRECLIDEAGNMKFEYQSGDGIHMTPGALSVLINYIRTHAYELQP